MPRQTWGLAAASKFSVDRLVGSHWFQQLLHRDDQGRYLRLPMAYHIAEERWIHINGRFLAPEHPEFFRFALWNKTCLYCHNTRPREKPAARSGRQLSHDGRRTRHLLRGVPWGGRTPRAAPTRTRPAPGAALLRGSGPDHRQSRQAIRGPLRGRLRSLSWRHGAALQGVEPAHACRSLPSRTRSEAVLVRPLFGRKLQAFQCRASEPAAICPVRSPPPLHDGRFWGDGTPLATATEYQGMAMSACYQGGARQDDLPDLPFHAPQRSESSGEGRHAHQRRLLFMS